jgi:hypothetical protein
VAHQRGKPRADGAAEQDERRLHGRAEVDFRIVFGVWSGSHCQASQRRRDSAPFEEHFGKSNLSNSFPVNDAPRLRANMVNEALMGTQGRAATSRPRAA